MKNIVLSALTTVFMLFGSGLLAQESTEMRTFLFVGTPNSAAWEMQIAAPADREAAMQDSIEDLGGKLLSYYWGLDTGKNYISVSLPDDPTFTQAFYLTRLGDDVLDEYQMIELMSSPDMAETLARVPEIKAAGAMK